jgi:hypothetical protein
MNYDFTGDRYRYSFTDEENEYLNKALILLQLKLAMIDPTPQDSLQAVENLILKIRGLKREARF